MRLIDADKIDFNEVFVGESEFAQDTRNAAQMLINKQPTAYDVDKVIEQLEEKDTDCEDVGTCNYCQRYWCPIKLIDRSDAIEIVKHGMNVN